ncbi:MAG: type II and III secretion system protein family protein [Caulobacter sp.]|nr:type II and III secretion system protein family protein [Caulobacter sp.]
MIRRSLSASLAAALALAPAAGALADGPVGGTHTYRPAAAVVRRPAPPPMAEPVGEQVLRVDLTTDGARALNLPRGKSAIVELPVDVRDMLVTNPQIADAVLRSPRRIYVLGMNQGSTDAVFFDAAGRKILTLDIRVGQDADALQDTLRRVLPNADIRVEAMRDSVILTGVVANAGESNMASQIASRFVSSPDNVFNMLSIAGKDQVMLKVRIVEVQRNVIKQLGVSTDILVNDGLKSYSLGRANTFGINGGQMGGADLCYNRNGARTSNVNDSNTTGNQTQTVTTNGGTTNTVTSVLQSVAATAYKTATGSNTGACVEAFERAGLVRTLAEPNLTVVSGEAGKFLVGGEFPVPTGQDTTGRVTIEFKPYGVGLGYTPMVLSGGRISLKLSTEVSELTSLGAFTLSTGSGGSGSNLSVPGLSVRRAETTVELPSGGSLMIAGLLQQQTKQNIDSLPGMTSLPILGSLFRSRDYLNGETELVVIITPYIVDATKPQNLQTPADGLQVAGDMSTVLLGRLNKVIKAPEGANLGRAYQGPVGYVID